MRPKKKILAEAKASPIRQMKRFSEEVVSSFGKKCSLRTLKRILRQANMTWKRLRNSLKKQRDEKAFRRFEKELKQMMQKADIQQYDLLFFDETGFNLLFTIKNWTSSTADLKIKTIRCFCAVPHGIPPFPKRPSRPLPAEDGCREYGKSRPITQQF